MLQPTPVKTFFGFCAHYITPFEVSMMQRFCALRIYPSLTWLFKAVSRLGDWPLWALTGLGLLVPRDPHLDRVALAAGLAVLLSVVIFKLIKNLAGRPRPFESWQTVTCLVQPPDRFSFPSGHTMTAFAVWGSLYTGLPLLAGFYLTVAVLIGLSRIFLGLHYPTDVLLGALLGGCLGIGITRLALC